MRLLGLIASLSLSVLSVSAHAAAISDEVQQKILAQGVPADALTRMSKFLAENEGRSFSQSVYTCKGKAADSIRPCDDSERTATTRDVKLESPETVGIIDFSLPSTDRRFYLINTKSGEVTRFYATHGVGTSKQNYASRFSNTKDSRQTSLGFYLGGGIYQGHYGNTMRMYGLQTSNDQGYNRDIVLHGAWYVSEDFMKSINQSTGQPYGRLGHSWGCPAVGLGVIDKIAGLLKNGGVLLHYHPRLMEEALKGKEIVDPEQPIFGSIPVPMPRPEAPKEDTPTVTAPDSPAAVPETQAHINP
jgi:hypothetical protein